MTIDHRSALSYLRGDSFSNGYAFRMAKSRMISRDKLLTSLAAGKTVLHVGCADHIELIDQKRKAKNYLHDRLTASASRVVGVDVDAQALGQMRSVGISDIYTPEELPEGLSFDLVLVPDVIEHVPNVADFLDGLRCYRAPVVVTTPNAFRWANRKLFRTEVVNSDHRYWFSPYTLSKCLTAAGYDIQQTWQTDRFRLSAPFSHIFRVRYPLCRDGLAVLATPS